MLDLPLDDRCARARRRRRRAASSAAARSGSAPAGCAARGRASPGTRPSRGWPPRRSRRAFASSVTSKHTTAIAAARCAVLEERLVARNRRTSRRARCRRDPASRARIAPTYGSSRGVARHRAARRAPWPASSGSASRIGLSSNRARADHRRDTRRLANSKTCAGPARMATPTGACAKILASRRACASSTERTLRAQHLRLDARDQLARRERLDQIVVGAGLQPLDARLLAGARRQRG